MADLTAWIAQKDNMCVFGAPWQADAQMVYLYNKYSWIEGIIRYVCVCVCVCVSARVCVYMLCTCVLCSEDSDMFVMGVDNWHT